MKDIYAYAFSFYFILVLLFICILLLSKIDFIFADETLAENYFMYLTVLVIFGK